jgi:uncharacterized membrane protein
VADLIAIGYQDETTALRAADEAERLAGELVVRPDAIAAVACNREGTYKVVTNHHQVAGGSTWGGFWGLLFGMLFFVPVFGMALGAGLGSVIARLERSGLDRTFQEDVRDLVRPGSSALFLIVEKVSPAKAIAALGAFGGKAIVSPLSKDTEAELQAVLQGRLAVGA